LEPLGSRSADAVASFWLWLVFLLLTARGLRAIGSTLLDDLRADSPFLGVEASPDQSGQQPIASVRARARVPLNRVLAFRGVARRVAARRRWEGGFGRRGL
jgi:hypothetical protein